MAVEYVSSITFGENQYILIDATNKSEEMTLAEYEALTQAQKLDGTTRYITDVSVLPNASGVGF